MHCCDGSSFPSSEEKQRDGLDEEMRRERELTLSHEATTDRSMSRVSATSNSSKISIPR